MMENNNNNNNNDNNNDINYVISNNGFDDVFIDPTITEDIIKDVKRKNVNIKLVVYDPKGRSFYPVTVKKIRYNVNTHGIMAIHIHYDKWSPNHDTLVTFPSARIQFNNPYLIVIDDDEDYNQNNEDAINNNVLLPPLLDVVAPAPIAAGVNDLAILPEAPLPIWYIFY